MIRSYFNQHTASRNLRNSFLTSIGAILLFVTSSTNAEPVTFYYEGIVNNVSPELSEYFSVGDIFIGSFTFESSTEPYIQRANEASYSAIISGQFIVGSYSGYLTGGHILVVDATPPSNFPDAFPDTYRWTSYDNNVPEYTELVFGPSLGPYNVYLWELNLYDLTNTAISSTEIPLVPPNLNDFIDPYTLLRVGFRGDPPQSGGQVTIHYFAPTGSLTLTPPPGLIAIDINPMKKSDENIINLKKKPIKVAILGSTTFDALQVDTKTVKFGLHKATPIRYRVADFNKDGFPDLILTFNTAETGIACGHISAALTGQTISEPAMPFAGSDSFTVRPCP